MIKVGDATSKRDLVALPPKEALSKVLDSISKGDLTRGTLPTFKDTELASLLANYATTTSTKVYAEPAEMTEQQWDSVFKTNRAFHGYWFDFRLGTLVKASKPGESPKLFKMPAALSFG